MWDKIKNLWSGLTAFYDHDRLKRGPRPFQDWQRLTIITVIIILVVFNVYLEAARRVNRIGDSISGEAAVSLDAFEREVLEGLAREITGRQSEFEKLVQAPPGLDDPSR